MAGFADHFTKMILVMIIGIFMIDVNANSILAELSIMLLVRMLIMVVDRRMNFAGQANVPDIMLTVLSVKIVIVHRTTTSRVTEV